MNQKIVISWCKTCRRKLRQTYAGTWMHAVGGWKNKQAECETGPIPGAEPPGKYVSAKEERVANARFLRQFAKRQRSLALPVKES